MQFPAQGDCLLDGGMNIRLDGFALALDHGGRENCYISHAHADHSGAAKMKNKKLLASEETLALLGKEGRQKVNYDGISLRFLRAGHVLGSTQLVVEDGAYGKFVYTGDFKVGDGLTIKGAEAEECDMLLIEGTYGSPSMNFPPREEVREKIAKWVIKENKLNTVLLGGYSTGKAQELIALLNQHAIVPLVHPRIEQVCKIYERFGIHLERIAMDSEEGNELKKSNFVGVMPFHLVNRELAYEFSRTSGRGVATALATGWANTFHYEADEVFPLSDHADFKEIIDYCGRSGAKKIYCCLGDEEYMAKALRKEGFNAEPCGEVEEGQQKLVEMV